MRPHWRDFQLVALARSTARPSLGELHERRPGEPWKASLSYHGQGGVVAVVTTIARLPLAEADAHSGVLATSLVDAFTESVAIAATLPAGALSMSRGAFRSLVEAAQSRAVWTRVSVSIDGRATNALQLPIGDATAVAIDAGVHFVALSIYRADPRAIKLASGSSVEMFIRQKGNVTEGAADVDRPTLPNLGEQASA